jgi:hypothetical protein
MVAKPVRPKNESRETKTRWHGTCAETKKRILGAQETKSRRPGARLHNPWHNSFVVEQLSYLARLGPLHVNRRENENQSRKSTGSSGKSGGDKNFKAQKLQPSKAGHREQSRSMREKENQQW